MRVERLQVDGFGHFCDYEAGPFDRPVTVIHGPNEAGKSTLLAFVRTMLFGFPASKQAQFYPPLNGGQHGGRIILLGDDGRRYVAERHAGPKGGICSVTCDGQPVDTGTALGGLLAHASQPMYRAVFAFGLDELQTMESLNKAEVGGLIYSAGMGAAHLPAALDAIAKRSDAIFKSGGSKQEVAEILGALDKVQKKLDAAKGEAGEYGRLTARRDEIERELGLVRERAERLNAVTALIDSLVQRLVALTEAETSRDDFAVKVKGPLPDQAMLEDAEAIGRIREGRKSFLDSVHDLPKRQVELRDLEDGLGEMLRDLGGGWDEQRLASFDTSVPARDAVAQWRRRLEDGDRSARDAKARVEAAAAAVESAAEKKDEVSKHLAGLCPPERNREAQDRARADLRAARTRLGEFNLARRRREDLEQQAGGAISGPVMPAWLMPLALGIASAVAGVVIGGDVLALGLVFAVVFAVLSVFLFLRDRRGGAARGLGDVVVRQLEAARRKEKEEAEALAAVASGLGLPDRQPTAEMLDAIEAGLDADAELLRAQEDAEARLHDAERDLQRAQRDLDSAARLRDEATREIDEARDGWQGWLSSRGLQEGLLPETVDGIFSRVEAARAKRGEVARMRNRVGDILKNIKEHSALVTPLARRHGIVMSDDSPASVMSAASALVDRYGKAHDAGLQRRSDAESLKAAEATVERRRKEVDDLRADLRGQFVLRGGNGSEELKRHEAVLTVPEAESRELLVARRNAIKQDLEEIESGRDQLLKERAEVVQEIKRLTGDEETSGLRQQRAVLVEQLRVKAREWSALTLARALLERTRAKFEEERQPDVIKHAQGFFETVTSGRYRRLTSPLGTQTVTVEQRDGRAKAPEQLSRGTQEQLYLALRFGLIREFGERATRLPVVVDEVLVNFDPDRARRAAEAFVQLAETNQVLVFTCHPETVDLFMQVNPGIGVIGIGPSVRGASLV